MLEIIFRPFVRHRSIGERVPEKFRERPESFRGSPKVVSGGRELII